MPGLVITIAQRKGGAGKTTLAAQLAVAWARQGVRVAVLDIDPQGSLAAWVELRRARLGASAIGCLPGGYVQNAADVPGYRAAIAAGKFATRRGVALTADDRLRRDVIEAIMCALRADLAAIAARHGADPAVLLAPAARLGRFEADGLVRRDGARLEVTEAGRPFVRSVAAVFDAYLREDAAPRHARAV